MATKVLNAFKASAESGRVALIPYITAGHPDMETTLDLLSRMGEKGCTAVELGIPFSDPSADGPVIQAAHAVGLKNSGTMTNCLKLVQTARTRGITVPIIFTGYYNTYMAFGLERLCSECVSHGVDGFIAIDLPVEEVTRRRRELDGRSFCDLCDFHNLAIVQFVSPTSPPNRIKAVCEAANSFIYVVARLGVTGTSGISTDDSEMRKLIECVKAHTSLPVVLGFGISGGNDVEQFKQLPIVGVIVGSSLVAALSSSTDRVQAVDAFSQKLDDLIAHRQSASMMKRWHEQPPALCETRGVTVNSDTGCGTRWMYGDFGGRFVSEGVMEPLNTLENAFNEAVKDPSFIQQFDGYRRQYINGPSPVYHAQNLSKMLGGAQLFFKREELVHTGAHKINNAMGQVLLAKRMGMTRVIAETGAGQHGVACATACSLFGLDCEIYMGAIDYERQKLNVLRMNILNAKVHAVQEGSKKLKDAINSALQDWIRNVRTTYFLVGSVVGPHPYPTIVKYFQSVIGREARQQMLREGEFKNSPGPSKLPHTVVACVGGGSNAMGIFAGFEEDENVKLLGVEAGGYMNSEGKIVVDHQMVGGGVDGAEETVGLIHSATISEGIEGVYQGCKTLVLQNEHGHIMESHSISAGLDYPAVGPEHVMLKASGRAKYVYVSDDEALLGLLTCAKYEGIIPALEPSHAIYYAIKLALTLSPHDAVLVHVCGRGDKDMATVSEHVTKKGFLDFNPQQHFLGSAAKTLLPLDAQ